MKTEPDGDGMPVLLKFLADTGRSREIRNPKSEIRSQRWKASGLRLEWQGGVAARQFLERSRNLGTAGDNWVTIFTNNPPTLLQTNLLDLIGTNSALFCRVRAVRE